MAADFLQQLQQIGSALGPVAASAVGFLGRAVARITKDVTSAKSVSARALTLAQSLTDAVQKAQTAAAEAKAFAASVNDGVQQLRNAIRLEVDDFKREVDDAIEEVEDKIRGADGGEVLPGVLASALARLRRDVIHPLDERIGTLEEKLRLVERALRGSRPEFGSDEETGRFGAIRSTMEQEQEYRRGLQRTLTDHMKDESEKWLALQRTLGATEAKIEAWTNEVGRLQRQIEDIRRGSR